MADRRRGGILLASVFLLLALSFLVLAWRFPGMGRDLFGGLFAPEKTAVSWSILEEIRELEDLETASYDMKAVFPFDFAAGEEADWAAMKTLYDRSPSQFLQKADPAWHPGGVLPPEWQNAWLYDLCREIGLDPGKPDHRFLVLSVKMTAGVDLSAWLVHLDEAAGVLVEVTDEGVRSLALPAPPVAMLSFVVEDRDTVSEGFPDIPLSPEEWSRLVKSLEPRLREMAWNGGLSERADSGARQFLIETFEAAGYDHVEFIED